NGGNEQFIYVQKTSVVDLEPEETISTEIAYHANLINYGLNIDIKWFHEKLDNLISEKLLFFDLTDLSNNGEVTLKGVELEAAYIINDNIYTKFGYGYLDSETNNFFEEMLYARHKGFISGVYSFEKNMTTSLTYYGSSTISTSPYNRIDWVTRKKFMYDKNKLSIEFKISNYGNNEDHKFIVSPIFSVDNKYDDSTHYFLSINYLL
ncbi:hypothetical protein MNBD_GAMMA08-281, partial [hydrothermal vent metagenome]